MRVCVCAHASITYMVQADTSVLAMVRVLQRAGFYLTFRCKG